MVQALRAGDRAKRVVSSNAISRGMEGDVFILRLIFSDEAPSHISGKIHRHNV